MGNGNPERAPRSLHAAKRSAGQPRAHGCRPCIAPVVPHYRRRCRAARGPGCGRVGSGSYEKWTVEDGYICPKGNDDRCTSNTHQFSTGNHDACVTVGTADGADDFCDFQCYKKVHGFMCQGTAVCTRAFCACRRCFFRTPRTRVRQTAPGARRTGGRVALPPCRAVPLPARFPPLTAPPVVLRASPPCGARVCPSLLNPHACRAPPPQIATRATTSKASRQK